MTTNNMTLGRGYFHLVPVMVPKLYTSPLKPTKMFMLTQDTFNLFVNEVNIRIDAPVKRASVLYPTPLPSVPACVLHFDPVPLTGSIKYKHRHTSLSSTDVHDTFFMIWVTW